MTADLFNNLKTFEYWEVTASGIGGSIFRNWYATEQAAKNQVMALLRTGAYTYGTSINISLASIELSHTILFSNTGIDCEVLNVWEKKYHHRDTPRIGDLPYWEWAVIHPAAG